MPIKRCLFLLIIFFSAISLNAATVSFLVIETGLDADPEANLHSSLWESGLLDVFFESGHIVSNAPVMRLYKKPVEKFPAEAQNDFNEALEGGVEYFIIAMLDYQNGVNAQRPQNITLRLFKTRPFEMLFEQKITDTNPRSTKEEYDNLKKAARVLLPRVK